MWYIIQVEKAEQDKQSAILRAQGEVKLCATAKLALIASICRADLPEMGFAVDINGTAACTFTATCAAVPVTGSKRKIDW